MAFGRLYISLFHFLQKTMAKNDASPILLLLVWVAFIFCCFLIVGLFLESLYVLSSSKDDLDLCPHVEGSPDRLRETLKKSKT